MIRKLPEVRTRPATCGLARRRPAGGAAPDPGSRTRTTSITARAPWSCTGLQHEEIGEDRVNRRAAPPDRRPCLQGRALPHLAGAAWPLHPRRGPGRQAGPDHRPLREDHALRPQGQDVRPTVTRLPRRAVRDVSFTVEAKKLYADGKRQGDRRPRWSEMHRGRRCSWLEPGKKGFDERQGPGLWRSRTDPFRGARPSTFVTKVPTQSSSAVDPYNFVIDRNGDDNTAKVTMR
jgi:hypothetical protein